MQKINLNKITTKLAFILLLSFTTSIVVAQTAKPAKQTNAGDLNFLKKLEGKYPTGLLEHPKLKARLKAMMKDFGHYDFINKEVWQTLVPNKIEGNYFIAEGMQLNSGGDPSATIIVDLDANLIYVGVRDQIEYLYTEKNAGIPDILKKWAVNTYPPSKE
ncbi:MAG: hypothetical protein KA319_00905 [Ferruginibacter sp.]|nr:hypothetical protein [Ferruginibacter sp.]